MKLSLCLLLLLLAKSNGLQIKFSKYVANSTKYAHHEYTFTNLESGVVIGNSTVEFFQDVLKEMHTVSVRLAKNDKDTRYEMEVFKSKADSCRVKDGVLNSIFMKVVMEGFGASADYQMKCPFLKGVKKMINQTITSKQLPPFPRIMFPSGQVKFYIKDDIFGKVASVKRMVHLYSWSLYGKVYDDDQKIDREQ